jgi:CheY-like chemotaxis protein
MATRRTKGEPRPLDLNAAVMEALDLVRPELTAAATDRAVRVDAHLGAVGQVRAPGLELRDVLCKLLVAARDELPRGGVVQLWTRRTGEKGELEIAHPVAASANEEATRLALDVSRVPVERWGGALEELEDGGVRRMRLRLPLQPEARPTVAVATPARADTRVLVVDDDAGNRETLAELLSLLGYQVDEAASSDAALALAERHEYHAALLDLAMPGMNGLELARRLRVLRPEARMALVTGWEPSGPAIEPDLIEAVFRKPINLPAIQSFLDGTPASPT